jgi:hypothetical protein
MISGKWILKLSFYYTQKGTGAERKFGQSHYTMLAGKLNEPVKSLLEVNKAYLLICYNVINNTHISI